jgi:hypothetical protein
MKPVVAMSTHWILGRRRCRGAGSISLIMVEEGIVVDSILGTLWNG